MLYRKLGSSGLKVSELSFGPWVSLKGYEWLRKHMIDSDRGQERMNKVQTYVEIAKSYDLDPIKLAIAWCLLN